MLCLFRRYHFRWLLVGGDDDGLQVSGAVVWGFHTHGDSVELRHQSLVTLVCVWY